MERRTKVGILGCGNISGRYVEGCRRYKILDVVACADIDAKRAKARAEEFGIPKACTPKKLLTDPDVELLVNLTPPKTHAKTSLAAIEQGKNVHSEKPLGISREEGQKTVDAARERGVLLGCAPDTFLGGGLQTSRKLIDDGWIGEPVAAAAFVAGRGPESWHPAPDFFYDIGGGPMLDIGPYYITTLVNLLGPAKRVAGCARISFPDRVITGKERYGELIPVKVPTHVTGAIEFARGPVATVITSFDVCSHSLPRIEIYGSEGSLSVPDPNGFKGPVRVRRAGDEAWSEVPLTHDPNVMRGIGVADMAYALVYGRAHRANGDMANHVLDIMQSFEESSKTGRHVELKTTCSRPEPLPMGLMPGTLDT